jgi:hypothetical protein
MNCCQNPAVVYSVANMFIVLLCNYKLLPMNNIISILFVLFATTTTTTLLLLLLQYNK